MEKEERTLDCPFCGEETIKVIQYENRYKGSRRGYDDGVTMEILVDGCPSCSKSKSEIKKKLKKKGFPFD